MGEDVTDGWDTAALDLRTLAALLSSAASLQGGQEDQLASNWEEWSQNVSAELLKLKATLKIMKTTANNIDNWLYTADFTATTAAPLWCVPADQADVPAGERGVITENGFVRWGSLQSVINCLAYNGDNEKKFRAFAEDCTNGLSPDAQNLPRSLVSGFVPQSATCADKSIIEQSAYLAANQSIKMRMRRAYLEHLKEQMQSVSNTFHAKAASLWSKAKALQALLATTSGSSSRSAGDITNGFVYGWKSVPNKKEGNPDGRWHVIQVLGSTDVKRLPWIDVKRKRSFGKVEITYKLKVTSGSASITVKRYDEVSPYTFDLFGFSSSGGTGHDAVATGLNACVNVSKRSWLGDAFIGGGSATCNAAVSAALAKGISATVRARYFSPGVKSRTFNMELSGY
jgi:hypothetical protein